MNTNNIIWEENKNTLPNPTNYKQEENDKCDTMNETKFNVEKNLLKDTIKRSGIYKIIHKDSGKYYLGSSKDIQHRWQEHKNELRKNKHCNDYLQSAWNKYGEYAFEFIIVELVDNKNLLTIEQKYLNELKSQQNKCYNLNFNARGGDISEYSRTKIKNSEIGKIASDELKKKLSDVHKGIKLSESAKLKLRLFNTGKKLSEEHKKKIGLANKGKKYSEEIRNKLSIERLGLYKGDKNPSYDNTIFNFYNKKLNIYRTCTCYQLYTEFGLRRSAISNLKRGKVKQYRDWIIIK